MEGNQKYFAFISYQRQDEDWAKWLTDQLEHYHLPLTLNGRDDLPKDLRPIFRDIDELAAGNLPQQIHQALENSKNLIVICSPNSAKSPWVNKEIETFIGMGKLDNIFPFIIDGVAFSKNEDEECLPEALRKLSDDKERLGANVKEYKDGPQRLCKDCPLPKDSRNDKKQGDINDKGRDAAVVKIVAGMLGIGFDTLWQRYEKEKAEEERRVKEQKDNLQKVQSRFLAEKILPLIEDGNLHTARLLALEALPKKFDPLDRPCVPEAEHVFREAVANNSAILKLGKEDRYGVIFACMSPNGKLIASSSNDFTIRIWNIYTGEVLFSIDTDIFNARNIDFSPDSSCFAAVWKDCLQVRNSTTGKCILHLHLWRQFYNSTVYFSPDGKHIVVSGYNIMVFDLETKEKLFTIQCRTDFTTYSPDGRFLISSSRHEEGIIKVWDASNGQEISSINTGYNGITNLVFFSPDGSRIIALIETYWIIVWDYKTMDILFSYSSSSNKIYYASFSPDGQYIIAAEDKSIKIWNTHTWEETQTVTGHEKDVYCAMFSPDGQNIISSSEDTTIRIWDIHMSNNFKSFLAPTSPLINSDQSLYAFFAKDFSVQVHNLHTRKTLSNLKGHHDRINCIAFSPNNKSIVTASDDCTIKIWDVQTGHELKTLNGHQKEVKHAFYNNNGEYIISTSCDGTVKIWDVLSGKEIHTFGSIPSSYDPGYAVFSPNNQEVLFANRHYLSHYSSDWHTCDVICIGARVFDIAFNTNGNLLAAALENNKIIIYDTAKHHIRSLIGHDCPVNNVFFSPDDQYIISSSYNDKTTIIWDVESGMIIQTISQTYIYKKISYNYYENKSNFAIFRITPLQQLIDETRERYKNCQLTPEERKKYYLD